MVILMQLTKKEHAVIPMTRQTGYPRQWPLHIQVAFEKTPAGRFHFYIGEFL